MSMLGTIVIWGVMLCAVAGAVASLFRDDDGLGKEFLEGLRSIGPIFIPVAGIMASVPVLEAVIRWAISSLHEPKYYRAYGRRHLDRFLAAAGQAV